MNSFKDDIRENPAAGSSKYEGEISRRELLKKVSPLGKVALEKDGCTGCGICAMECPTSALVVSSSEEPGVIQLLFKHGKCIACGICVETCPEKCLSVERILEIDKMDNQTVLFEDEIIMCSECGSPIGPRAMIAKLQAKVGTTRHAIPSRLELCPTCKIQAQLSQVRI